ncbi:hypothetical protein LguiA_003062 [Lonicera macranthoides]
MYSYVGLLSGLCGAGRIVEAVNVYHGIVTNHFNLDAYILTVILERLIKSGNFQIAVKLFRKAVAKKERDIKMVKQILREMIDRGIELDCSTFNMIMSMFRSRHSHAIHHLFIEFLELGLISNKTLHALLVNGLTNAGDAHFLLKGNTGEIIDVDLFSSEDLSDVAASLG